MNIIEIALSNLNSESEMRKMRLRGGKMILIAFFKESF